MVNIRQQSSFVLKNNPFSDKKDIPFGMYALPRYTGEAHMYRIQHPLAQLILKQVKRKVLEPAEVVFVYDGSKKISILEPLVGASGELLLTQLTVEALDQVEDYLIFSAVTSDGQMLDDETAKRLFSLMTPEIKPIHAFANEMLLIEQADKRKSEILNSISARNASFFEAEADKLDNWADDLKITLEREIKEIDRQIKEAKRSASLAATLEEKLAGQRSIRILEKFRNDKRKALFETQDEIDKKRGELINQLESKLSQKTTSTTVLKMGWSIN